MLKSAFINGRHLFSVLSYSALQVFWHFDWCWLSDHDAHPLAGPLEQHLVKAPIPVQVHKVIYISLMKEVPMLRVNLTINAKE